MKKQQKGFTLIELLVVIAIIGLLSTLAVVALNNARQKSRDAKRVSDIKQVQTALELYYNDANGYPPSAGVVQGGTITYDPGTPLDTNDDTVYMALVPKAPEPPSGDLYTYTSIDTSTYQLTYTLEGTTGGIAPGPHTATPAGIVNDTL